MNQSSQTVREDMHVKHSQLMKASLTTWKALLISFMVAGLPDLASAASQLEKKKGERMQGLSTKTPKKH